MLKSDTCKIFVVESLQYLQKKYHARLLGYVIMPNHIHLILYYEKENTLSAFMRDLKKFTFFQIRRELENSNEEMFKKLSYRHRDQLFKVWNDRFDDVWIGSRELLEVKLDYIHLNPLQEHWNLCSDPTAYFFSSANFYENNVQAKLTVTHYRDFF